MATQAPQPGQPAPARPAQPAAAEAAPAQSAAAQPGRPELPGQARVVIIGGGVIGTSIAYHLTALGWTDVLLLEQGQLSCGTTWHAAEIGRAHV